MSLLTTPGEYLFTGTIYNPPADPSGTRVPTNASSITDNNVNIWTLGTGVSPNIQILLNGSLLLVTGSGVYGSQILWFNDIIYIKGDDNFWYLWTGSGLTFVGADPQNPVTPVGYFVRQGGSNANSGTDLQPWATIAYGVTQLSPGDTLWVHGGIYNERIPWTAFPSGTSWSAKVRLANYPGEVVWMRPTDPLGNNVIQLAGSSSGGNAGSQSYIEIDGINLDGSNFTQPGADVMRIESGDVGSGPYGAHHIRVQNLEMIGTTIPTGTGLSTNTCISNPYIQITASGIQGHNEFINLTLHHAGGVGSGGYGLYCESCDNVVMNCHIFDIRGAGISNYNGNSTVQDNGACRNIYANLYIHDVHPIASSPRTQGIVFGRGDSCLAFNCLIVNVEGGVDYGYGLDLYHNQNLSIYNCTVYNCTQGIQKGVGATGTTVIANCLSYGNSNYDYQTESGASAPTLSTNFFSGVNPLFVGSNDFHLQSGSTAKDAGTTINTVRTIEGRDYPYVTTDRDGTARPIGSYSVGCYEK